MAVVRWGNGKSLIKRTSPLPDRKRLDDIVFDAIGLTAAERKEIYWSVCELVKNRLDTKSVTGTIFLRMGDENQDGF